MRRRGAWFVAFGVAAATLVGAPRSEALLGPVLPVRAVVVLDAVATHTQLAQLDLLADIVEFEVLPMVAVQATPLALDIIEALPFVDSVWENRPLELALEESTTMIGADAVHEAPLSVTGAGVGIAVLDSGIDGTHPGLAYGTKTIENVKLLGYTRLFRDHVLTLSGLPNTDTTTGHGTHVAGIAAGTGDPSDGRYAGVAPGADLIGIGAADGLEMLTALGGYDWILANHEELGIRVINNSWADGSITYDPDDPLNIASKAAHDAGITVVFAAGNDGQAGGNVYNRYAWPDWVIGVGGVTKTGALGEYSSRGDAAHHADLAAPGSWIVSARASTGVVSWPNQIPIDLTDPANPRVVPVELWPWYTTMTGTSMAAPHVAGVVALLLEADPTLTPDEIKAVLTATASPLACAPVDCGAGLVDADAAVSAVLEDLAA